MSADPRIQVAGYVADPLPYLSAARSPWSCLFRRRRARRSSTPGCGACRRLHPHRRRGGRVRMAGDPRRRSSQLAEGQSACFRARPALDRLRTEAAPGVELAHNWRKSLPHRQRFMRRSCEIPREPATKAQKEARRPEGSEKAEAEAEAEGSPRRHRRTQRPEGSEKAEAEAEAEGKSTRSAKGLKGAGKGGGGGGSEGSPRRHKEHEG